MTDRPLGSISTDQGRTILRFTRPVAAAPEMLWPVLTESEHMRWWMPADMIGDRSADAIVRMVFWPDLVEKMGLDPDAGSATIRVWERPGCFEWVWHESIIRFDAITMGEGSELTLSVDIGSDDPATIADNAAGFHTWMDHIVSLINDGASPPIAEADSGHLEALYREMVAGNT